MNIVASYDEGPVAVVKDDTSKMSRNGAWHAPERRSIAGRTPRLTFTRAKGASILKCAGVSIGEE